MILKTLHDFEDIIFILDNTTNISDIINNNTDASLKSYLSEQCLKLLANKNIEEAVSCALPLYSEEERIFYIIKILNQIRAIT